MSTVLGLAADLIETPDVTPFCIPVWGVYERC